MPHCKEKESEKKLIKLKMPSGSYRFLESNGAIKVLDSEPLQDPIRSEEVELRTHRPMIMH